MKASGEMIRKRDKVRKLMSVGIFKEYQGDSYDGYWREDKKEGKG